MLFPPQSFRIEGESYRLYPKATASEVLGTMAWLSATCREQTFQEIEESEPVSESPRVELVDQSPRVELVDHSPRVELVSESPRMKEAPSFIPDSP